METIENERDKYRALLKDTIQENLVLSGTVQKKLEELNKAQSEYDS